MSSGPGKSTLFQHTFAGMTAVPPSSSTPELFTPTPNHQYSFYNFAKGHPNPEELPVEELRHLLTRRCGTGTNVQKQAVPHGGNDSSATTTTTTSDEDTYDTLVLREALQYGPENGNPRFIAQLGAFLDRQCIHDEVAADFKNGKTNNDGGGENNSTEHKHHCIVTTSYTSSRSKFFITEGVSHGIDLLSRMMTIGSTSTTAAMEKPRRPVVWTEHPTYFLVANIFRSCGWTVEPALPSSCRQQQPHTPQESTGSGDAPGCGGIDMDALARLLEQKQDSASGTIPRMIYIIPAHHNPTGVTMSCTDRQKLAVLAHQYEILVVADEVYHLLDWGGESMETDTTRGHQGMDDRESQNATPRHPRPARMVAWNLPRDPNMRPYQQRALFGCVSVSSFTKIFAPGVRCGWIEASRDSGIVEALEQSIGYLGSQGGVGPVMSSILQTGLEDQTLDQVLRQMRQRYQYRANLLCDILEHSHAYRNDNGNNRSGEESEGHHTLPKNRLYGGRQEVSLHGFAFPTRWDT